MPSLLGLRGDPSAGSPPPGFGAPTRRRRERMPFGRRVRRARDSECPIVDIEPEGRLHVSWEKAEERRGRRPGSGSIVPDIAGPDARPRQEGEGGEGGE